MKNFYLGLLSVIMLCSTTSCGSNDEPSNGSNDNSDEVKVYLTYALETTNGGSMSRTATTNEDVFNEFYAKIKTGELLAPSYNITFTNVETGVTYNFKGNWADNEFVTLRTGTYNVTGYSTATGNNIQEKCSIVFDEQISISITSKVISLNAKYDCSLLIFNDEAILTLQNYNGKSLASFFSFSTYKYAFVNDCLYDVSCKNEAYIIGKYTNDAEFLIYTGNLNFEKGKYYVYNSVSNSFTLPPMTEGTEEVEDANREIEGFGRVADAVDLGLSVKWASWNVGASQIADYGGLYGAGDPTGLLTSTSSSSYHYVYGENICGSQYDLAYIKWGDKWRLPSMTELTELKNKCSWSHNISIDGVKGSMATGPNGNTVFFPYAGSRHGSSIYHRNTNISIWSGDAGTSEYNYGYKDLDIYYNGTFDTDGAFIYDGQSIRPVRE